MRILILQLARLGDILQSLPAIQGLKRKYPNSELTLVARSTFADAAKLSPHVDKLVELSTKTILEDYLLDKSSKNKADSYLKLGNWIASNFLASNSDYDLVINLTFSPASAALASLIPAKQRRGIHCLLDGTYAITDSWSQYVFAQVLNQNYNILHLNDLFMRIAGAEEAAWPLEIREFANKNIAATSPERTRVGIQIGSSKPEKTLDIQNWVTVCAHILSNVPNSELVFFGSQDEVSKINDLVEKIPAELISGRHFIVAGTLEFHENTGWVKSCNAIVSPDTALVHLASICGTRVIEIPLGSVRAHDTGPYGNGHDVLFPAASNITQLSQAIVETLNNKPVQGPVIHSKTKLVDCIHGVQRNVLVPQNFVPDEVTEFFTQSYYLLTEFRCAGRQEDIAIPQLGSPDQPGALDRLSKSFDALCAVRRIAQFGQNYCLKMFDHLNDKSRLHALMEKLNEVESMLISLQKTVPIVKPLIDTWIVDKDVAYIHNGTDLNQNSIERLKLETAIGLAEGSYRELMQNVDIIQQLLQLAVDQAHERAKKNLDTGAPATKAAKKRTQKHKEMDL